MLPEAVREQRNTTAQLPVSVLPAIVVANLREGFPMRNRPRARESLATSPLGQTSLPATDQRGRAFGEDARLHAVLGCAGTAAANLRQSPASRKILSRANAGKIRSRQ